MRNKISRTIYIILFQKNFFFSFWKRSAKSTTFFFFFKFLGVGGAIDFGGKGFEVSKSHNEDKVFREPVDTPFKKELLQLSCALQLRKIIIDHSEEKRNFV